MASHRNYVKKQIAIDTVSWTGIVAPMDCMSMGIKNSVAQDMKIRTDAADPATQDLIPAGNQEYITVPRQADETRLMDISSRRFLTGETIAFLQAVAGTGPALVTFVQ